jgi:hypothetical protein
VSSVIFTQAAREELIEAQDWYESEGTGRMGDNFRQFLGVFKNSGDAERSFRDDPEHGRSVAEVRIADNAPEATLCHLPKMHCTGGAGE